MDILNLKSLQGKQIKDIAILKDGYGRKYVSVRFTDDTRAIIMTAMFEPLYISYVNSQDDEIGHINIR